MFAKNLRAEDGATERAAALTEADELPPPGVAPGVDDAAADRAAGREFAERWLDWQCRMISGVRRGLVLLAEPGARGAPRPLAVWPASDVPLTSLLEVAVKAANGRAGAVQQYASEDEGVAELCDYVAYPLHHGDRVIGAVALAMSLRSAAQRRAVLQLMQWGSVWLQDLLVSAPEQANGAQSLTLDAVRCFADSWPLPVLGHQLCNLLADRLSCARVALGLCNGLQARVIALSHQVKFDRRVARISAIENAMEECTDQARELCLPVADDEQRALTQAHAQLLPRDGSGSVCSVPLMASGEVIAVVTMLRDDGRGFDGDTRHRLQALATTIGPLLDLKRRSEQSILNRFSQLMHGIARRLFGPGFLRAKLLTAFGLLAVVAAVLTETDHQVTAPSTIEGESQQAVVAPFAGYVLSANARAGDRVNAGDLLASLDDRDLLIEQKKWQSEREKHAKEYQEALAKRDRPQISILAARIAQVEAQLEMVDGKLQRTQLRAPFDGVLVSGDLSRSLGVPVDRGQLLYEIVPMRGYRVALQVDERDVKHLKAGQRGNLRLAGFPEHAIPLRIARVLPVAAVEQGVNRFRVEAEIVHAPEGMRPGMQGVAKVVAGRSSLLWAWTHALVDRIRLWAWSLGL